MSIVNTGKRQVCPTHPGEMLREDFLPDFGLTASAFAEALGVPRRSACTSRWTRSFAGGKNKSAGILAKNYGATAATVMSAECSVPGETAVWRHRFLPIVIPPGETERISSAILPPTPDVNLFLSDAEGIEKIMPWFHVYIGIGG